MSIAKTMEKVISGCESLIHKINWKDTSTYGVWLSQQRYIVQRSVPYLGLCVFRAEEAPEFQSRCREHMGEESGHEKLLDQDLKTLGLARQSELAETKLVYQPQFYQISMQGPLSFLGYVFFLEMLAPAFGPTVIQSRKGLAVDFLKVHAHDDEDHLISAQQILGSLNVRVQEKVLQNFEMTAASYKFMLETIASMEKQNSLAA